jgi:GrpB-like predicted nucleotidyltransferase (UPF0157 family)
MKTKHVVVEDYNPAWEIEFHKIEKELLSAIEGKVLAIEHIGSTAIKGLSAKPIIDIDIVIDDNFAEVKELLSSIGYHHEGDLGIPGREAFKYEGKIHLMPHHLYVCNQDSAELHRHIVFRSFLQEHAEWRDKYSAIKKEMALQYPYDIEAYMRGKAPVIEAIFAICGLHK